MKIVIFVFSILMFFSSSFSQNKKYSVTFYSGAVFPGYNLNIRLKTGSCFGAEYQNYKKPWAFVAELNNNFFYGSFITQASIGPRFYLSYGKISPFTDLTGGLFLKKLFETSLSLGISPGIGAVIDLSEKFGLSLKAKWHLYLGKGDGGIGDYSNILAGIKYNF